MSTAASFCAHNHNIPFFINTILSIDAAMYGFVEDKESEMNMDSGDVMEHAVADTVAAMSEGMLLLLLHIYRHYKRNCTDYRSHF